MVVLSHDRLNRGRSLSPANQQMAANGNPQFPAAAGGNMVAHPHHNNNNNIHNEDDRGFLELQACIPHLAENKRASRLDILLEAINYIDILHSTLLLKIQRGDMSGDERRKLISSYLKNIVSESNKENY